MTHIASHATERANFLLLHPVRTGLGGGALPRKRLGMLIGIFELKPQRRLIWAWFELYLTPKDTSLFSLFLLVKPLKIPRWLKEEASPAEHPLLNTQYVS